MEILGGEVVRITFRSEESGFTVARLKTTAQREPIIIVGTLPLVEEGMLLECEGRWKTDPTYGVQFVVSSYTANQPTTEDAICKYLSSGVVKGLGVAYAERIVRQFGVRTLDVLDNNPKALREVHGIGKKRAALIEAGWKEQRSVRYLTLYLQAKQLSASVAQKIYRRYGDDSVRVIEANPYQLARDIHGIGFATADKLATQLGIAKDAAVRMAAGIEHTLHQLAAKGNACFPVADFLDEAARLLGVPVERVSDNLQPLVAEKRVTTAALAPDEPPRIWLTNIYQAEQGIAEDLQRLAETPCPPLTFSPHSIATMAHDTFGIHLSAQQEAAVAHTLQHKVHLITGGPGTGKSTITKVILHIFEKNNAAILLAAPTGRAAKRLSEITGREARTIHSLLGFDTMGFRYDRRYPLTADLVVIDEASMIDTLLMHSLLRAVPNRARVLIIGDADQLPSIGAGDVLRDLLASGCLPQTRLTEIFRQSAASKIILTAHRINRGDMPDLKTDPAADFFFIQQEDPAAIQQLVGDLMSRRLPARYGFDPFQDIQVLSPMKKGLVGTIQLNEHLQKVLNPTDDPLQRGGQTFHLHDKVMQLRNDYEKGVFNGDIGSIIEIDRTDQNVTVLFDNQPVSYDFGELDHLQPAYAVSVHKYQGSECPCIIMVLHPSHYLLLYRSLLYTGITRGKRLVILIGSEAAIRTAVCQNNTAQRFTGLRHALRTRFAPPQNEPIPFWRRKILVLPWGKKK